MRGVRGGGRRAKTGDGSGRVISFPNASGRRGGRERGRASTTREGRRIDARRKMSLFRPRSIASAMSDDVRRARVSGVTINSNETEPR